MGCGNDHSPPISANVKNGCSHNYTSSPTHMYFHGAKIDTFDIHTMQPNMSPAPITPSPCSQTCSQLLPPPHLCMYLSFPLQITFHHKDKAAIPPKHQHILFATCMSIHSNWNGQPYRSNANCVQQYLSYVFVITIPMLHNLI